VSNQDQLVELVDRAGHSDPEAWEALYRRVYPGLMAYASRRLDADRAREAVAETMARAVAGISRFTWRPGGSFDAWLYGILRHVVVDAHRAGGREATRRSEAEPSRAGPLDHVLAGEEARAVRAAFERLGEDDREILELRVVAGFSAEEVGKVLGRRAGAVRMAQSRALARLRHELERGS
jgi:RNA polymerase sigma-70 factor (ECF subfamily)